MTMSTCQGDSCAGSCGTPTTPEQVSTGEALRASTYSVSKMDCPSEENLIRMALSGLPGVGAMAFDLAARKLRITHFGEPERITEKLLPLNLGATFIETTAITNGVARKTRFAIPKMDCPSEENLIRMALADASGVAALVFDLKARELTVAHEGKPDDVLARLVPLNLGARVLESIEGVEVEPASPDPEGDAAEATTLKLLLGINGAMFVFEMIVGVFAQSTGLIADSLDMFADAAVYGLALYAVGRTAALKLKAAHIAGWLQVVLALGALSEVIRRALFGSEPQSALMMGMGLVALAANVICLVLIAKKRDRGAHMTASYIFSANDVIANAGVIAAGALVAWTGSSYPDLVIGTLIALVVLNGARRILKLS
ncbi:cation transporter [Comamonas nitrativorans]|uniref:Cation transporter n=1 Tax=Comamonas nitrativorans TaxID=108437 RepID=A0ABV9GWK0_9BURK